MLLGIGLILASTVLYNSSVVLLAAEARRHEKSPGLVLAVGARLPGALAILLNLLGYALEVAALLLIPLTLVRVLSVAGLGILLVLARWALREPLGYRELLGVGLVASGMLAVSLSPPHSGSTPPTSGEWLLLLAVLGTAAVFPYVLRLLRRPAKPNVNAVCSGLAYALSGILTKGAADILHLASIQPLILLVIGIIASGLAGFTSELDALQEGYASVVTPIITALQALVPIILAPILFGELWPAGLLPRALLGGGILLTVAGTLILTNSSPDVPSKARESLPEAT